MWAGGVANKTTTTTTYSNFIHILFSISLIMSSGVVTLFDIPSKGKTCWSPNTWKSRLALAYKGVPFKTEWVEYPDIKPTFPHLSTLEKPLVTLPIIKVNENGNDKLVTDSWDIAEYLEEHVTTGNSLFRGNMASHFFFQQYLMNLVTVPLRYLLIPRVPHVLLPRSEEYFRRTRQEQFGQPLNEMLAKDPQPHIIEFKSALKPIHLTLRKTKAFLAGDHLTYSDIILLSLFLWVRDTHIELFEQLFVFFDGGFERIWYDRCISELHPDQLATK